MNPKYTLCALLAKFQVVVWVFGPVGIAKMAQNDDILSYSRLRLATGTHSFNSCSAGSLLGTREQLARLGGVPSGTRPSPRGRGASIRWSKYTVIQSPGLFDQKSPARQT